MTELNGKPRALESPRVCRGVTRHFHRGKWEIVDDVSSPSRFAGAVLPHLDTAYNLARWLTGNDHDAEDVVQEAYLRALRFFGGFQGDDIRAWLLKVVRNTGYTWLKRNRPQKPIVPIHDAITEQPGDEFDPASRLNRATTRDLIHEALEQMPAEFREAIVLRELEGLSYKQIATVAEVPIGTVMSRLARGRELLRRLLAERLPEE